MSDAVRWPLRIGENPACLFHFAPGQIEIAVPPLNDALSDPDDETAGSFLAALLPTGAAWGTPDNQARDPQSVLAQFWTAVGSAFGDAYRTLFNVTLESSAVTLVQSLDDWELDYGLPDLCLGSDPTEDQRRRSLIMKIRSAGTITPADFVQLAADAGYSITIEEPMPFRMGASRMGGPDALSGKDPVEYVWIVHVPGVSVDPFRMGDARMGFTPLGNLGVPEDLKCLFNRVKPAWTTVIFAT